MRGILLDLDDTLLDDRTATRNALSAFLVAHRPAWKNESEEEALLRWRSISSVHWRRFEEGKISFHDQRRARVRDFLGRTFTDAEADLAFEPYRITYESSWSLVPDCKAFIALTAHIPKVIITNGDRGQQLSKVQSTGLNEHVVGVVTPMDCGHWKPRPEIFLAALALLKLDPDQCLMIGDDPVRDIQPSTLLGMRSFQVEPGNPRKGLLSAVQQPGVSFQEIAQWSHITL